MKRVVAEARERQNGGDRALFYSGVPVKRFRVPSLRFSVERVDDERWMLVDWRYGVVKVAGKGGRIEQEQVLAVVKVWFSIHGDVNILAIPKRLGSAPRWPGGICPESIPFWREEQQQIARAYARLGVMARGRDPKEVSRAADFKHALRAAACLHEEALCRLRRHVGLEPR